VQGGDLGLGGREPVGRGAGGGGGGVGGRVARARAAEVGPNLLLGQRNGGLAVACPFPFIRRVFQWHLTRNLHAGKPISPKLRSARMANMANGKERGWCDGYFARRKHEGGQR